LRGSQNITDILVGGIRRGTVALWQQTMLTAYRERAS
jgi:hypothetical protein